MMMTTPEQEPGSPQEHIPVEVFNEFQLALLRRMTKEAEQQNESMDVMAWINEHGGPLRRRVEGDPELREQVQELWGDNRSHVDDEERDQFLIRIEDMVENGD